MSPLEDFAGHLRGFVISVSEDLDPTEAGLAMRLIDHDEGGEAVLCLAWQIVENDRRVTREAITVLRGFAEQLGVDADLPPQLDDHART